MEKQTYYYISTIDDRFVCFPDRWFFLVEWVAWLPPILFLYKQKTNEQ